MHVPTSALSCMHPPHHPVSCASCASPISFTSTPPAPPLLDEDGRPTSPPAPKYPYLQRLSECAHTSLWMRLMLLLMITLLLLSMITATPSPAGASTSGPLFAPSVSAATAMTPSTAAPLPLGMLQNLLPSQPLWPYHQLEWHSPLH